MIVTGRNSTTRRIWRSSISLEAAELLECFQWSGKDLEGRADRNHMSEELADVLVYCIYLADTLGVSIADIVSAKD